MISSIFEYEKDKIFHIQKSYRKKLGFVLQTDKAFNSIFSFVKEDGLTFLWPVLFGRSQRVEKLQKKPL